MIDCSNAEIRDRLPELVHGRLDAESLAEVQSHLAGCTLCQAEVRLLERARAALIFSTPRVDTAGIVSALPTPNARVHRTSFDWRIAAVIAVLVVGGGGTALMYEGRSAPKAMDTIALVNGSEAAAVPVSDGSELPISGDLSGLTDDQLRALVGKVESIEALPSAEPRPSALTGVVPVETASHDPSGAW